MEPPPPDDDLAEALLRLREALRHLRDTIDDAQTLKLPRTRPNTALPEDS
jgi:hypothetical protein